VSSRYLCEASDSFGHREFRHRVMVGCDSGPFGKKYEAVLAAMRIKREADGSHRENLHGRK
jgi:hypothetical protein